MKKHALLIVLQLLFCSLVMGQTDNPGCQKNISHKDSDCSQSSTCATATACPQLRFSMDCTSSYSVIAYTECSGTGCSHCASCVRIRTLDGTIVFEITTSGVNYCQQGDCCETGIWTPSATGDYYLEVCLVPCQSVDGEVCCIDYGCAAWGKISDGALSCP